MSGIGQRLSQYFGMLLGNTGSSSDSGQFEYRGPASERESFTQYYNQHLRQLVQQFEDSRIEYLSQYRTRNLWVLVALGLYALVATLLWKKTGFTQAIEPVLFIGFVLLIFLATWASSPVRSYHASLKSVIFPKVVKYFGESFDYSAQPDWPVASLKMFDVLPRYDKSESEDQIHGEYKGVPFEMMELTLTKKSSDSKKNDRTMFKGFVIQLQANKPFAGKTVVVRDGGLLGKLFKANRKGLERVELEDPEFEKKFDVFSSDQIEARYLLTPAFMERLRELRVVFFGKALFCSFFQDKLFLAIETSRDLFAPSSIHQPVSFSDDIASIMHGMSQITKIIDRLKLDQKTHL